MIHIKLLNNLLLKGSTILWVRQHSAAPQPPCSLPFQQIHTALVFSANREKEEEETRINLAPT